MRNNLCTFSLLLVLGFHLVACSTSSRGVELFADEVPVEMGMPATPFLTSESSGQTLKGRAQIVLMGGPHVQLIDDIDSIDYSTRASVYSGHVLEVTGELGLFKRLDVFYLKGLGLRAQIFGPTRLENKPGLSMSVAFSGGPIDVEVNSSDTTGSVKDADSKVTGDSQYYLLVLGYRPDTAKLFYGGPFYSETQIDKVTLFQTNNTNFTFRDVVNKGEGSMYGFNIGILIESPKAIFNQFGLTFGFEAAYAHTEWEKTFEPKKSETHDSAHLGGSVGVTW